MISLFPLRRDSRGKSCLLGAFLVVVVLVCFDFLLILDSSYRLGLFSFLSHNILKYLHEAFVLFYFIKIIFLSLN